MAVQVTIEDHTGNVRTLARLSDTAEVDKLIRAIITSLKLPVTDSTGKPITYYLAHNGRRLHRNDTLSSAEVEPGDTISIVPEMGGEPQQVGAVKVFCSYAHADEKLLKKLQAQLYPLQRKGLIAVWHDQNISAGTQWEAEISMQLNIANIILLLVSPDFIKSDYCYSLEVRLALERHRRGEARAIPIILRSAMWRDTPLGELQALPRDGKPVAGPGWHNQDEAFLNIAEGIKKVVEEFVRAL